ncbi:outer membrane protein assembly factor BamB family protein [Halobellus rufus]|uniref:outer membrane protein assembly factor BamB family protein n=1 Tax=Halobellus rufus TaxID=1448860 RepID=UPI000AEEC200|nr:PQQ-binding-like beta-propeller repeat protein [Halobellus rufus]
MEADSNESDESGDSGETSAATKEWAQFRGEPGRAGVAAAESAPDRDYVTTAWLGTSGDTVSVGEPIVADGAVYQPYVVDDKTFRGGVVAFEAGTSEERWRHLAPEYGASDPGIGRVTEEPAVADGLLLLTSEAGYTDSAVEYGGLHALDAQTGETVWQKTPEDYETPNEEWLGTPLVADGTLYVSHLTNAGADPAEQQTVVEAIDPATGERQWRTDGAYRSYVEVAGDGALYGMETHTDAENEFVAWDASDGSRLWGVEVEAGVNFIDSAFADGSVYRTGGNQWQTSDPNRVASYSTDDGSVEWETTLTPGGEPSERLVSAPAVADGTVYVTTALETDSGTDPGVHSTVYALDADTGDRRWTHDIATELHGDPSIADDTVYVGGRARAEDAAEGGADRRYPAVHALSTADGTERWSHLIRAGDSEADTRASTPVLAGGRVYVNRLETGYGGSDGVAALEGTAEAPPSRNVPAASDTPIARITTDPDGAGSTELDAGTTVVLDGGASSGEVETYEWQLGEKAPFSETGETIEVTLDFCGTLDVTLRVTGPDGQQSTDTVSLSTD